MIACSRSLVRKSGTRKILVLGFCLAITAYSSAQTDCAEGDSPLDTAQPKNMTVQQVIDKFGAAEEKIEEVRSHYTYTQDVMIQTLTGNTVDGQMHQVTTVSYDDKGKRLENVTFAEQSTLRNVQLTAEDWNDIRVFMPLILSAGDLPQYKLTYAGQQHVDDLDTYVFLVEPRTEEKGKRYYQGRIWIDNQDFAIVKACGKSVPDLMPKKKNQPVDVRPTFVSYRQLVDGYWFPAYVRVDDTLHFGVENVHLREIVKFTGYKRSGTAASAAKP